MYYVTVHVQCMGVYMCNLDNQTLTKCKESLVFVYFYSKPIRMLCYYKSCDLKLKFGYIPVVTIMQ